MRPILPVGPLPWGRPRRKSEQGRLVALGRTGASSRWAPVAFGEEVAAEDPLAFHAVTGDLLSGF
jgi:hypothetical protein